MGLAEDRYHGLHEDDVEKLIHGQIQEWYTFNPISSIAQNDQKFVKDPSLSDIPHVLAIVIDCSEIQTMSKSMQGKLRKAYQMAKANDTEVAVLLTKIDKVHSKVAKDVRNATREKSINEAIERVAVMFSMMRSDIFYVKNYEKEQVVKQSNDALILLAVKRFLELAEDCISNRSQNPAWKQKEKQIAKFPGMQFEIDPYPKQLTAIVNQMSQMNLGQPCQPSYQNPQQLPQQPQLCGGNQMYPQGGIPGFQMVNQQGMFSGQQPNVSQHMTISPNNVTFGYVNDQAQIYPAGNAQQQWSPNLQQYPQQGSDNHQPMMGQQQHRMTSQQPMIGQHRQPMIYQQPMLGEMQQPMASQRLMIGQHRQPMMYQHPMLGEHRQPMTSQQPITNTYDAFVSYNDGDRDWVQNKLVPVLEDQHGIKLCIHEREFDCGTYIQESIIEGIESSRHTMLIVSPNFLKSTWCHFEMILAHNKLFFNGKDVLLLVLLAPLPMDGVSKILKTLLKTKTYIEWTEDDDGQRLFWDKLVRAVKAPVAKPFDVDIIENRACAVHHTLPHSHKEKPNSRLSAKLRTKSKTL